MGFLPSEFREPFENSRPSLEREAHRTCKLYMPQYRGIPGPKRGSGGGMGDFWDSIGNVNEENM